MKKGIFHEQEPANEASGSQQEDVKLSLNDIIARSQLEKDISDEEAQSSAVLQFEVKQKSKY